MFGISGRQMIKTIKLSKLLSTNVKPFNLCLHLSLRAMDFPGHFEQIFQQLNYQRVHGQLWDCVIVVGSRHFKAHRSVLAACSTHFRALFTVAEGDASMNMIQLDSEVRILTCCVKEDKYDDNTFVFIGMRISVVMIIGGGS